MRRAGVHRPASLTAVKAAAAQVPGVDLPEAGHLRDRVPFTLGPFTVSGGVAPSNPSFAESAARWDLARSSRFPRPYVLFGRLLSNDLRTTVEDRW